MNKKETGMDMSHIGDSKVLLKIDAVLTKHGIKSTNSRLLLLWLVIVKFAMTITRFILHRFGIDEGVFRETILFLVSILPLASFAFSLKNLDKRDYLPGIYIILAMGLLFALTALIHPEYKYFFIRPDYGIAKVFMPNCAIFAFLFMFLCLKANLDETLSVLKIFAFFEFFFVIIVDLSPRIVNGCFENGINYLGEQVSRKYSMSFGYDMLVVVVIFFYNFIKNKKSLYLIGGIVGMLLILIYGNRGALCIGAGFLLLLGISNIIDTKQGRRRLFKYIGIVFLIFLFYVLIKKPLLSVLNVKLMSVNIESRTLEMLKSGEIFKNLTGRDKIWHAALDAIKTGGLFGRGVFGDRPVIFPIHYVAYCHNIFLELLVSFGILGFVAVILLIVVSLRMIFQCKDRSWRELFIIFFSLSTQLMLSWSFWYVMEFWATAAIAWKYISLTKKGELPGFNRLIKKYPKRDTV